MGPMFAFLNVILMILSAVTFLMAWVKHRNEVDELWRSLYAVISVFFFGVYLFTLANM